MLTIAIDGPAASGKGTLAKRIAAHYGLACLDTGLLYRAVGRDVLEGGQSLENEAAAAVAARSLDPDTLDDPGLRTPDMGDAASVVAKFPKVRAALLELPARFRGTGTRRRARRPRHRHGRAAAGRREDLRDRRCRGTGPRGATWSRSAAASPSATSARSRRSGRDARDMGRKNSPMRQADDAVLLDTTTLNVEQALAAALAIVKARIGR